MYEDMSSDESQVEQIHTRFRDSYLAQELNLVSDKNVLRHFYGFPIFGACSVLHEAAIVCLNASWWQKEPFPTTEFGIAELMVKGLTPTIHAENILNGMRVAHARIIPNAHLQNYYSDSGDPEQFNFGVTKFVTMQEARRSSSTHSYAYVRLATTAEHFNRSSLWVTQSIIFLNTPNTPLVSIYTATAPSSRSSTRKIWPSKPVSTARRAPTSVSNTF